jgi:transaldolase
MINEIRLGIETGLVDGVTTNPSIIAKSGRSFTEVIRDIVKVVPWHISVEVMAEDAQGMIEEALIFKELGPQIAIKVPMTTEGLKAVPVLEKVHDIRVNVTMVFSPTQAYLAMKSGASFVSIVLSRLDAIGSPSSHLINDTMLIKNNYDFKTRVIAGSVKTQNQVLDCLKAGVDIATIPFQLFEQLFKHPLTDAGLETFKKDFAKIPQ